MSATAFGTFVENERSGLVLEETHQRRFLARFLDSREGCRAIGRAARDMNLNKGRTEEALDG